MADYELVIRARRAVTPGGIRPATVAIRDGKIVALAAFSDAPDGARVEELPGEQILLPGLVDTHVHVNEPGRTEWEGFATATRAAAAGGVTTLVDMPLNCLPPTTTAGALAASSAAARGQLRVDVGFWGGAVPGNLAELAGLHRAGVFGFKAFLVDSGRTRVRLSRRAPVSTRPCRGRPARCAAHRARRGCRPSSRRRPAPAGRRLCGLPRLAAARPPRTPRSRSCSPRPVATARACTSLHLVVGERRCRSSRAAKADGVRVSAETCPHYLTFCGRGDPRRRDRVQVLPADPRLREPRRVVGRARGRR